MHQDDVLKLFKESEALLEGHFQLTSGLHSSRYLQCALVLQTPRNAEKLGAVLAERLKEFAGIPDFIIAPALGGILVAHEVARTLNVRGIFAERQTGKLTLRRGFRIAPGERCFVVEDVVTTGGSTRETMDVARGCGAEVLAAGALINRGGGRVDLGIPAAALATLDIPNYQADQCPMCQAGSKAIKPGSR